MECSEFNKLKSLVIGLCTSSQQNKQTSLAPFPGTAADLFNQIFLKVQGDALRLHFFYLIILLLNKLQIIRNPLH